MTLEKGSQYSKNKSVDAFCIAFFFLSCYGKIITVSEKKKMNSSLFAHLCIYNKYQKDVFNS